jgi:LysM repeat protein
MGPRIQFDLSSISQRDLILIIGSGLIILVVIIGLIIAVFGMGADSSSGAAAIALSATASPALSATPSLPPSPTLTFTPDATATLEPYTYTVQAGDTLGFIIQVFGYRDFSIVPEVLRLNGLASETGIREGQVLLIPRQTPVPGPIAPPTSTLPPGVTETVGIPATAGPTLDPNAPTQNFSGCTASNRCISPDGQFWVHEVQSGDTIAGIAYAYTSRLDSILQANGLTTASFIVPGEKIYVPILVTLTPTLTPTGAPDSTATPYPTPASPSLVAPANAATLPRSQPIVLQWAAVGPLSPTQSYLIVARNVDTGQEFRAVVRSSTYRVPASWQPGLGQGGHFEWQVVVIVGTDPNAASVSGSGQVWTFNWGG